LSQSSSPLNKQNELIRSLRRQLEATERELAEQKWVFEQFLKSPSWRLTAPLRWLKRWLGGEPQSGGQGEKPGGHRPPLQFENVEPEGDEAPFDLKNALTAMYRVQLRSFLASNAFLELPKSDVPEVSVLIVLYNRAELTLACLRSLKEHYSGSLEIIIVDNASSDDTSKLLDRLRGVRVIRNAENLNFLLAVNQAAREAHGKYLLVLNNDTQLLPGALESAFKTIGSSADIGAVGGRLILLDGTLQEAGSIIWRDGSCLGYGRGDDPFAPTYMFRRDVDYCSGAFLLTPRALWNQMGGFDEAYKPAYYEETDYCMRLWERGFRVVFDPDAVLLHYEFASSSSVRTATDLQWDHQALFVARHREALGKQYTPELDGTLLARMRGNKKRILSIDDRVPHTWCGSGYPRARTILFGMLEQGFFVTLYPASIVNEEWSSVYSDIPREVEVMLDYGPSLLEAFLRNRVGYYDTIFVSRPHNMKLLARIVAEHPDWFESVNIIYDAEAIFAGREVTLKELRGTPFSEAELNNIVREEVTTTAVADCVVSVSDAEKRAFEAHGVERVHILGHLLEPAPVDRGFDDRKGFLFVGAVHQEESPNGDALIWFLEEVFPLIQNALGADVTLTIVGYNTSGRIRHLAGPSVRIIGLLRDLTELYGDARVFVAPTRYAAGIPHKIHESAARGLPVVATELVATQLGWNDNVELLVGRDAASFAKKCIELYQDKDLWMRLRKAGLDRVKAECSKEAFDRSLKEILATPRKTRGYEVTSASRKEF
jgi:GT2 family glycosyltransferase/glycosyltransferase involved in cell wall biosynthesis